MSLSRGALDTRAEGIMTTIKDFIARHAAPTYFVLTFAVSWGGVLLVIFSCSPARSGSSSQRSPWPTDVRFRNIRCLGAWPEWCAVFDWATFQGCTICAYW